MHDEVLGAHVEPGEALGDESVEVLPHLLLERLLALGRRGVGDHVEIGRAHV